ncbi:unnamed protein product [Dovyalis caffra]|uniref:NAD-dependent epimerase/dehydratase domain-containing protein n=1 Tax=Dovyalis caffra TaxID=77055 RepID=A0AAV1SGV2_9ROSI|nr:unnamed protein product [Dovyalis caffra]
MQAISRRLGHQSLKPSASLSSFKSIYPVSDHCNPPYHGADHQRYGSTLATKGVGHLVRKGTGGRSSVSGIVATVFGATGFLGRYVVQQLAKMGSQVLVPFRGSEDDPRHLKLMGDLGQIVPMKYNPRDEDSIKAVMAKANVVINLIGRDYETRNYSFEELNQGMAEQLAMISKEHGGIMRFIQVSCLGASASSPSRMLRAKAAGEEAVLREMPEATVMKPAVMIGTEDRILNRWAHFAKKYSFLPLIGDGSTKIQPVYVVDVAAAIIAALKDDGSSMGKVYELGGPEIFTLHELAEMMYDMIREYPRYVKVPFPIAKALAMPREILLNKVPFPLPTPNMFNLDEINTLTVDTVVSENALTFSDFGIVPHKLKGYPIEFLISYRKDEVLLIVWKGQTLGDLSRSELAVTKTIHAVAVTKLSRSVKSLMAPESSHGSFNRVNLEGRNVGAAMSLRHGVKDEPQDSYCINIFINNNVQGVNNSILLGSEVSMRDPGVSIFLEDVKLKSKKNGRHKVDASGSKLWFLGMIVLAFILFIFLLLS